MPQRPPSSRPRRAALALTAVLVAALPACGESAADEPAAAAPAGDGAWPVTIEHAFGETTIEEEPQRVVTVGFTEADLALALGVTPVGVRDHLGYDHANRPWAVDLLPAEPLPTVGDEAIDLEAVADLGLATLGTGELSPGLVGELDRDALVVVGVQEQDALADPLLAALPVVREDRTLFLGDFTQDFSAALGFSSPLSIPFALDVAVPRLAQALDGDPATAVEPYTG